MKAECSYCLTEFERERIGNSLYRTNGYVVAGNKCHKCRKAVLARPRKRRVMVERNENAKKEIDSLPEFEYSGGNDGEVGILASRIKAKGAKTRFCRYCQKATLNYFACSACWADGTPTSHNQGHLPAQE